MDLVLLVSPPLVSARVKRSLLSRHNRRIYVDSRLTYMLDVTFNEPFFTRGGFPSVVENGSTPIVLENPWVNGTNATPFDQRESPPLVSRPPGIDAFVSLLFDLVPRRRRYQRMVP